MEFKLNFKLSFFFVILNFRKWLGYNNYNKDENNNKIKKGETYEEKINTTIINFNIPYNGSL